MILEENTGTIFNKSMASRLLKHMDADYAVSQNYRPIMSYWAIREKTSKRLMPIGSRGYHSRTEFHDHGPPRLFTTIGGAKTSLNMWCKGYWATEKAFETTNEYGDGFYYQGLPVPLGKGQRDESLYEIVKIDIFVKSIES